MKDNGRFFTNTYITSSGRQNYLRIDYLEDPLFTSFTFDIDYVSSPLFYTINNNLYGYPTVEGMSESIDDALDKMYKKYMGTDQGYDILPLLSASILDGNKLGFGLQQNVYTDMPLYGATEYIYMVDKRNGSASQNDVRFDNNQFNKENYNNEGNSYKLGDSVKQIVNDSDKAWAQKNEEQNKQRVDECDIILNDNDVRNEHFENKTNMDTALKNCNDIKVSIEGVSGEFNEEEIMRKIDECKKFSNDFEQFKNDIVVWANGILSKYQNIGTSIYMGNACVKEIVKYDDINDSTKSLYEEKLEQQFGSDFKYIYLFGGNDTYSIKFVKLFNELVTYKSNNENRFYIIDDGKSFLLNDDGGYDPIIRESEIIKKFGDKLEYFGLYDNENSFKGSIRVFAFGKSAPYWATIFNTHILYFVDGKRYDSGYDYVGYAIEELMSYKCDIEESFDENFTSDKIDKNNDMLIKCESALNEIRIILYGYENGKVLDKNNPSPDSKYGIYLELKEKYENDDYSQAENTKSIAQSGVDEIAQIISDYEDENEEDYNSVTNDTQSSVVSKTQSIVASQTVLDMLGFIRGMQNMTKEYPYIIQGVSGLDVAYNKHYSIKDPYLGSGEDKITLTCLESLDLRVSSMFNRYFNAIYDRQYRRERVPVNLRRFNCSIYVHDVRNFVSKNRLDKQGTNNRLLELTDMYYSVIEFRFFDCEIVPEETGNIFNDVSNEAPSDMKKTNFTFTYGNCVVNFVPQSEVATK